jgi:hypothetical protein
MYKIQIHLIRAKEKKKPTEHGNIILKWKYLSFISLAFLNYNAKAQFTLSGEIRPRTEFRNGFKSLNTAATDPAFFTEQRSRLSYDFEKEKIAFKLTLQDIRIWGNTSQLYKSDPSLTNIFEAWGSYKTGTKTAIKIGRQALSYDNERFFGELDWAQQSRSHDAAKFIYKDSTGFQLHIGAAFNQNFPNEATKLSNTYYDGVANYKTMQYLWLHKDWKNSKTSFLMVNDGRQKTDSTTAFRQTLGVFSDKNLGKAKLTVEAYYQTGKNTADKSISAYLASANVSFPKIFASPLLGFDYLSGTNSGDTKDKAFDPSFGTNHKFYGHMDYFYVGNPHQQNGVTAGLIDIYLQTKFTVSKKTTLSAHFHQFYSPVTISSGTEEISSSLGQEIDLIGNINLAQDVNLKLGYSHLFSDQALNIIKNAVNHGPNQWAWAMLTINPVLFSNK